MMLRTLIYVFVLGAVVACSQAAPSEADARRSVSQALDDGDETRLKVVSFTKRDARSMEFGGMQSHEIFFTAEAEFVTDAMFETNGPMGMNQFVREISTSAAQPDGGLLDQFRLNGLGLQRAKKGERLLLSGTVAFERRESGWVAVGRSMSLQKVAAR
ncbi:MAG: hypothetical protein K2Y23_22995 [Cyanobacteria bacterium]|nr:hypothetical protein [Cyanobacteriota bacterium]